MRMANCERCGKVFPMLSVPLCPECREYEDQCLRRAKEILLKEPNLGIIELAERLGEPLELLEKFLRQRLLVLRKKEGMNLSCEICGKRIVEGRRCPACEVRLRKMVESSLASGYRDDRNRMHSLKTIKARQGMDSEEEE